MRYEYYPDIDRPRRRSWMVALPLVIFIVVALLWSGGWYYASTLAQGAIDGWRARETQRGRIFGCTSETIGGYPFRLAVGCADPSAEWLRDQLPLSVKAKDLIATAQVYDPTLVITEFTGPVTVGTPGEAPAWTANWTRGRASVRGLPASPERISTAFDKLTLAHIDGGNAEVLALADHLEVHGRLVDGSTSDNPVIETVLRLSAASAPKLHALAAEPISGEITLVVWGLKDFSPKPWPVRLREMQAAGGHIDIKQLRLEQGETIIVSDGTLALTPNGLLDGQMRLTVVGLQRLLSGLNLDRVAAQVASQSGVDVNKVAQGLDRIMPGLGGVVRNNSGAIAAVGVGALGQPSQIDGKPAVSLPLRFSDGMAFLGPIPLGPTLPLF